MCCAYPLTLSQQRIWFEWKLNPQGSAYNNPLVYRLNGPLDQEVLRRALESATQRFDALRSRFMEKDGEPFQLFAETEKAVLDIADVTGYPAEQRAAAEEKIIAQNAARPFNLLEDPVYRFTLIKLQKDEHVLVLNVHHIAADGVSANLLLDHISQAYKAIRAGSLPVMESDGFVAGFLGRNAESGYLTKSAAAREYWMEHLSGAHFEVSFPSPFKPEDSPEDAGERIFFALSREHSQKLRAEAREHRSTTFIWIAALFQAMLFRLFRQESITLGYPISVRQPSERQYFGFLVNTLPLCSRLHDSMTFLELTNAVRQARRMAKRFEKVPYVEIAKWVREAGARTGGRIFNVSLTPANFALQGLKLEGIHCEAVRVFCGDAKDDLGLLFDEAEDGRLVFEFEYRKSRFDKELARQLPTCLQEMARSVADNPTGLLGDIHLLPQSAESGILFHSRGTAHTLALPSTVSGRFERQADVTPDVPALFCGHERLTYRQLDEMANQFAHAMLGCGVRRGAAVAVCLNRSARLPAVLLGALKIGAAYVPLDPAHPRKRLDYILRDAKVELVITERLYGDLFAMPGNRILFADDEHAGPRTLLTHRPAVPLSEQDTAYVIYTSGSTGNPKGVSVRQESVVNLLDAFASEPGFSSSDRLLAVTTVAFDIAGLELFLPLICGGSLILAPSNTAQDGFALAREIEKVQPTVMQATPAAWRMLLDAGWSGLSTLVVLCGGEALPAELGRALSACCAGVWNVYGPTETTIWSSKWRWNDNGPVAIGRPLHNTSFYVLDPNLHLVPSGISGELYIGGLGVANGYLNRPELTSERFIPDPFSSEPGARMYCTGDQARVQLNGTVEYLGRGDTQVKIRGFRIEIGEIEAALRRHPAIKDAIVIAQSRHDSVRLAAHVIVHVGQHVSEPDIRAFLKTELPEYMLPSVFCFLEKFPLTPNGKIDRAAFPALQVESGRQTFESPGTAMERTLAQLWSELLTVRQVSRTDHFFMLGGHSLIAMRLLARLKKQLGVELPLRAVFDFPVLADFAQLPQLSGKATVEEIGTGELPDEIPASFSQEQLWQIEQIGENHGQYHMVAAFNIHGELDIECLDQSLSDLIRRHSVLRTRFKTQRGKLFQEIIPPPASMIAVMDLQHLRQTERQRRLEIEIRNEGSRPFDLGVGLPIRSSVFKLAPRSWVWLVTAHHAVADGSSAEIFACEIASFYNSRKAGRAPQCDELKIQYAQFAIHQRKTLSPERINSLLDYWRLQLQGVEPLSLPLDYSRPAERLFQGGEVNFHFCHELSGALREFCRSRNMSAFNAILALFQSFLHRYTGQEQIVVGTPVANRGPAETESLIGCFVNTVVLRGELGGNPTFSQAAGRCRQLCLDAFAHQELPFGKMVEELAPGRDTSRHPFFDVFFVMQPFVFKGLELEGLQCKSRPVHLSNSKFDLSFEYWEDADEIHGRWEYDSGLFSGPSIERWSRHFQQLSRLLLESPAKPISSFSFMTEEECRTILYDWNATEAAYPNCCIHHLFGEQARKTPSAIALTFGNENFTYEQLSQLAATVAHNLRANKVGRMSRVAVCLDRSAMMVMVLLGVLKAGAAYVPLDPRHPIERLRNILDDAEPDLVVSDDNAVWPFGSWDDRVVRVSTLLRNCVLPADRADDLIAQSLAYVIFTSGSTGRPKGIAISHRNCVNILLAFARQLHVTSYDVLVAITTIAFDIAALELFLPLITGGRLVLGSSECVTDGYALGELISKSNATLVQGTPATWQLLFHAGWKGKPDLRALCGGEALPAKLADSLLGATESVWNVYGPTETTVWSSSLKLERGTHVSIGKPLSNTRIYVLDAALLPTPIGVAGEIYIAGDGLAQSYWNRPALTAERFLPDPFVKEPGARMYRTGDCGSYLPNGEIQYSGRADLQVKIRGFRIELAEIEGWLARYPGIHEAAVIVHGTGGEQQLVAYFTSGQQIAETTLAAYLSAQVPAYMIPSHFIRLDALPLNANRKVDRQVLRSIKLPSFTPNASTEAENLLTAVEQRVALLWSEVLQGSGWGPNQDFFAVGGQSLTAMKLLSRVRQEFGVRIPPGKFFAASTIRNLALLIDETDTNQKNDIVVARKVVAHENTRESWPLSWTQQRQWFVEKADGTHPVYYIPALLRIKGHLNVEALGCAFSAVVNRHEILRTVFPQLDGTPCQVIQSSSGWKLKAVPLPHGPGETVPAEILDYLRAPFALECDVLFRARLYDCGNGEYLLAIVFHHLVFDGWSMNLFASELATAYAAFLEDHAPALPSLAVQYRDYAVWERQPEVIAASKQALTYWQKELRAWKEIELPLDYARPPVRSFRGDQVHVSLPVQLASRLRSFSRTGEITPLMFFLACYAAALYRYTGSDDILIGMPVANRILPELEPLIGFFANTVVMRNQITAGATVREFLNHVRRKVFLAYEHQEAPFDDVVNSVSPERSAGRNPLFDVAFAMQPAPFVSLPGAEVNIIAVNQEHSMFDLVFAVAETPQGYSGTLQFNTDLFSPSTAGRLASVIELLVLAFLREPETCIDDLNIFGIDESRIIEKGGETDHITGLWPNIGQHLGRGRTLRVMNSRHLCLPVGVQGRVCLETGNLTTVDTGFRGRLLASGETEFTDWSSYRLWHRGEALDLGTVAEAVRAFPGVADACCISRPGKNGRACAVVYVVSLFHLDRSKLRAHLRAAIPELSIEISFVRVNAIPLNAKGEIAIEQLNQLPVIEEYMSSTLEGALGRNAAVVIAEAKDNLRRLHLSDVVSGWDFSGTAPDSETVKTPVHNQTDSSHTTVQSLSSGGLLDLGENPPRFLRNLLERAAKNKPLLGLTIIGESGETSFFSFSQLYGQACQVASGLQHLGLRRGNPLILHFDDNAEFLIAFWACQIAHTTPLPVLSLEGGKLDAAWKLLGEPVILTATRLKERLARSGDYNMAFLDELRSSQAPFIADDVSDNDIALLMLTSGSTGASKAVKLSHRNLISSVGGSAIKNELGPDEITLNWMSLDHVAGLVYFHLRDMFLGCQQIHVSTAYILVDPLRWLDLLDQYNVTVTFAPNFAYGLVNERMQEAQTRHWDLSSIKGFLNGGEAILALSALQFLSLLGPHGARRDCMWPAWGMSETSSGVVCSRSFVDDTRDSGTFVNVGCPIPGFQMRIVDHDNRLVAEGTIGSLQVTGAQVTSGYWNNPEETRSAFTDDGWFKTGDLAFLKNGQLTITGREKDTIILSGVNYPGHYMEGVVERLPEVEPSCTAACAIQWPTSSEQLAIFFCPKDQEAPLLPIVKAIRAEIVQALGITPQYVVPLTREQVPKTSIGKIQRGQLKKQLENHGFDEILKRLDVLESNSNTIPNWFSRKIWRAKKQSGVRHDRFGQVLVLRGSTPLAQGLVAALERQGRAMVEVSIGASFIGEDQRFTVNPRNDEHFRMLFAKIKNPELRDIIYLWDGNQGIDDLLSLLRALSVHVTSGQSIRLFWVDGNSQKVHAEDKVDPYKAATVALLKSAAYEMNWLQPRHLDMELEDRGCLDVLLAEFEATDSDREVAYRRGERLVPRLKPLAGTDFKQQSPFQRNGTYLLAGAGAFAFHLAKHLINRYSAHVVLVGRTPLDQIAVKHEEIASLLASSKRVLYCQADISDSNALEKVMDKIEEKGWPTINGIVHLAGIFESSSLLSTSVEQINRLIAPKVHGMAALSSLLRRYNPDGTLWCVSSVNGFFGGRDAAAYSCANAALESVASELSQCSGSRVRCYAFSLLDNIGMSRQLPAPESAAASGFIPLSAGNAVLSFEVAAAAAPEFLFAGVDFFHPNISAITEAETLAQETICIFSTEDSSLQPAQNFLDEFGHPLPLTHQTINALPWAGEAIDRVRLYELASAGLRTGHTRDISALSTATPVQRLIAKVWSSHLKVSNIQMDDNFFVIGGHSLLVPQIVAEINDLLLLDLKIREFFESPTLAGLSKLAEVELANVREEIHMALAELESMTDSEAEQMAQKQGLAFKEHHA